MINLIRMILVNNLKHLEIMRISIVMSIKESVFFTSQPSVFEWKLGYIAFRRDGNVDVIGVMHVVLKEE